MIEPYLNLNGRASEAMDFYAAALGGTDKHVMLLGDMPSDPQYPLPEEMKNRVAFAQMTIHGSTVNFSDMQPDVPDGGKITLMIHFPTPEALEVAYNALQVDGFVLMELLPQSYAKAFAWVQDKFGIGWQLICQ